MEEVIKPHNCLGVGDSLEVIVALVGGIFPDDIVIEILSRLPVKSLMRFKSVSKHWSSLIIENPQLIDLHCKRSKSRPNLLYINPLPENGLCSEYGLRASFEIHSERLQQSISWGEIVEGSGGQEAIVSKVRITDDKWFYYDQVLEPVNGLVCFVDRKTYAVSVYNGSTREATPWVKSMLLEEENHKPANKNSKKMIECHSKAIYRFGFDPEKREHKVFCFWRLARTRKSRFNSMELPDYECWEALTVGRDTKWRRINVVPNENNHIKIKQALPPASSSTRQVYVDGTIYWSNKGYYGNGFTYCNLDDPDVIVAFDVGSEKYRVIPLPDFILNDPREETYRLPIDMLVLGGQLALLYRMEPYVVKLWILDDRANKKLENCRGSTSNWSSETIKLPFCCDDGVGGFGIGGSADKMLFECRDYENSVHFVSLYSYDRRKKTCKKIEMDGVSSFTLYCRSRSKVITFSESLFPVQPLNKTKVWDVSLVCPSLEVTTVTKNRFPVQPLDMSKISDVSLVSPLLEVM